MFADMPADSSQAVLWLDEKVAALDEKTKGIRERHDASGDPAERTALARDLMVGLWMRGTALERQGEFMVELVPARADEFRQQIAHARAEQQIARQHLWGDPSQQ